jgi:2,5-dihydroxypyridine 5,6-dioxygenase
MWEYRPTAGAATELLPLFRDILTACALQAGETLLVYADSHSPPHYAAAFVSAAEELGAVSFQLVVPANSPSVETGVILEAFKGSDMVIDLASYSTSIYRPLRVEALKAGTRILRVTEPEDVLFRMRPDPVVRDRARRSEELVDAAQELHVTSAAGTDIVVNKEGRKAFGLWGIADRPGSWDHYPMGLVVVGGNRAGTNGTIVLQPGDILLAIQRYVSTQVVITVEEGVIVSIEGSLDAQILRQYFEQWDDPRSYWMSHVGWGCDHRAQWDRLGRKLHGGTDDVESFYGVMQIAFGRDTSFLGGTNDVPSHMDLDCLGTSIALDGSPVLEDGEFVLDELRHDRGAAVAA